jgi:hypothetical protein
MVKQSYLQQLQMSQRDIFEGWENGWRTNIGVIFLKAYNSITLPMKNSIIFIYFSPSFPYFSRSSLSLNSFGCLVTLRVFESSGVHYWNVNDLVEPCKKSSEVDRTTTPWKQYGTGGNFSLFLCRVRERSPRICGFFLPHILTLTLFSRWQLQQDERLII